MGDFIGMYYAGSNSAGNQMDERVISQHLALLKTEQPVTILEMEQLDDPTSRLPARIRDVDALSHSAPATMEAEQIEADLSSLPLDSGALEDDLEIPVASMSTFEQGIPSMVSVQLLSGKGDELNGKGRRQMLPPQPQRRRIDRLVIEPELEYDVCSPLSAARLAQAQVRPRRRITWEVSRTDEENRDVEENVCMEVDYDEILKCEERAARHAAQAQRSNLKSSLLRLLGRRGKK